MQKICCLLIISIAFFCFQEVAGINKFLSKPFDLQKFKNKKRGSNSGPIYIPPPYFYKPNVEGGLYYAFFLFYPDGFVYEGDESKKTQIVPGFDLEIVTFKPEGRHRDMFIDPNETLIQVEAYYNDIDLPELAFVGLDTAIIKKKLGEPHLRKDSCLVYLHNEYGLALHTSKTGTINWYRYTRTNKHLKAATLPPAFTLAKKKKPRLWKRQYPKH